MEPFLIDASVKRQSLSKPYRLLAWRSSFANSQLKEVEQERLALGKSILTALGIKAKKLKMKGKK
jgi:hypothetical protein